jgi:hypothetical protein
MDTHQSDEGNGRLEQIASKMPWQDRQRREIACVSENQIADALTDSNYYPEVGF